MKTLNEKIIKKIKKFGPIPLDEFMTICLYDKKLGYYSSKNPIGCKGDYVTSPEISQIFGELIGLWLLQVWYDQGSPSKFNLIELGPGNGTLMKDILRATSIEPNFKKAANIFLIERSKILKQNQSKQLSLYNVIWKKDLKKINNLPIFIIANEFFDALPIKQFKRKKNSILEKNYKLDKNYKVKEVFYKALKNDIKILKSYKSLKKLHFIELPKLGFQELKKMIKKISKLTGCILIIDYGYLKSNNRNTLQSVMKHKKNSLLDNLGKADITSHVNFNLPNE